MELGLIGLPNSGKTVVFNALTGFNAEVGYFHKEEPNIAVVEVKDERIEFLQKLYNPNKTTFSHIEVLDFPGSDQETKRAKLDTPELKQTDALAFVLRNFDDPVVNQSQGEPDPLRDLRDLETEMLLTDLQIAEKRLEKVRLNLQRGVKSAETVKEEKVLQKVVETLQAETPLRLADISPDEEKVIRGFQLLTIKPAMIIINSDEKRYRSNQDIIEACSSRGYEAIDLAGKFEMELLSLEDDDAAYFLSEMGIDNTASDAIINLAYRVLGYISFFTVGKQEVRAWTVVKGSNAQEAAGKIHSDMERGFIRAECFHFDDIKEFGSERALKEQNRIRIEGKNYILQDGDIMLVRFSV